MMIYAPQLSLVDGTKKPAPARRPRPNVLHSTHPRRSTTSLFTESGRPVSSYAGPPHPRRSTTSQLSNPNNVIEPHPAVLRKNASFQTAPRNSFSGIEGINYGHRDAEHRHNKLTKDSGGSSSHHNSPKEADSWTSKFKFSSGGDSGGGPSPSYLIFPPRLTSTSVPDLVPPPLPPKDDDEKPESPMIGRERRGIYVSHLLHELQYPLAYDHALIDVDVLDQIMVKEARGGSVSALEFHEDDQPERCLDLGCGTGAWILEAAKQWKDCHFTGFDAASGIQPNLSLFPSYIAGRVNWIHGNLLETLPFLDNTFDHIRISGIACGIPEDKWDSLLEECTRVLKSGGSIEVFEEDIIFPVLPRSFTALPPGFAPPSHHRGDGEPVIQLSSTASNNHSTSTSFSSATTSTGTSTSTPPWPRVKTISSRSRFSSTLSRSSSYRHSTAQTSATEVEEFEPISITHSHSTSNRWQEHDHSDLESLFYGIFERRFINLEPTNLLPNVLNTYLRHTMGTPIIKVPMPLPPPSTPSSPKLDVSPLRDASAEEKDAEGCGADEEIDYGTEIGKDEALDRMITDLNPAATSAIARASVPRSPVPRRLIKQTSPSSIALHLYRASQRVLACKEAMWEEMMLRNKWTTLERCGAKEWYGEGPTSKGLRRKYEDDRELFDNMIERYASDMHRYICLTSLLSSQSSLHWPIPLPWEAQSKANQVFNEEVEKFRKPFLGDDATAKHGWSRIMGVFVGFKE